MFDSTKHAVARLSLPGLLLGASLAGAQQPAPPSDAVVLSLRELVTTALKNNIDLRGAELLPRLAGADLLAARGGFDPFFSIATQNGNVANDVLGNTSRVNQSAISNSATLGTVFPIGSQLLLQVRNSRLSSDPFIVSSTQPFQTSHGSSLNLALTQPLLRGLGRAGSYGAVDAATTSVDASRHRYDRSADITIANVERAYWTLRQAETNETVARQSVAASRAIYERNLALQQRDVATALDVLTSERGLATRETQLFDATRQRVDAADRLLFLVYGEDARGTALMQASRMRTSPDSATLPAIPTENEAVVLAFAQRGDAIAAARDVDAGRLRAEQSRSLRLPRLDLVAQYGYGGTAQASGFLNYGDTGDLRSSSWSLGLSTSLFQHNDAARAVDERAEATLDLARMARVATENVVRADVRSAIRALETGRDRFMRAADVGRLAEKEYALALEGSRLGLVTTFQLLQYEDALAQARLLGSQARFALEDAGTQYRLAIGAGRRVYERP